MMSTLHLYVLTTLIWSSTWLAIKFQLAGVPPAVSVVWRFALSAAILLAYAKWRRLPLRFSPRDHAWMALQGFFMFGPSYVCVYLAEQYLVSGLVAVVFSLMVFWNIVGMRLFFSASVDPMTMLAAVIGVVGVSLVFWPELEGIQTSGDTLIGLGIAVIGTIAASLGNMTAMRNQMNHIPIVQLNGWAMMYGSLFIAAYAAISGLEFTFDWSVPYVASLVYLAVLGSVLAFGAYLTLLKRIGADRAGYMGVAIPVVALVISTAFEDLRWQAPMVIGVLLCAFGNVLILRKAEQRAHAR